MSEMNVDLGALARPWTLAPLEGQAGERTLAFESWDRLAALLTAERYRILHHLHDHPEPSVNALAEALDREFRRVHEDVTVLEMAGLIDSSDGTVRVTADRLSFVLAL